VLTEEEIARFQKELSEILAYVNKLQEIEVKDVEPTSQVTGLKGIMRQDKTEPERTLTQEAAVKPAKKVYNGLFVARKVL
jgi:aspartyl-tRNA(Asn)/glutamyl-tRNA(Gln) amidotransferase subunit C